MALIIAVVTAIVAVGITVAVRAGGDRGSDSRDRKLAYAAAQEGDKVYRAALSSNATGEWNRFVLSSQTLRDYVNNVRCSPAVTAPCWMPSSETAFPQVDGTNIPAADQITIRKRIEGGGVDAGAYSFWQVLALVPPRYGRGSGPVVAGSPCVSACVAPGGRVATYMRAWVGPLGGTTTTKPIITRSEFRAAQFSDYEIVADGKIRILDGATIDGAVHSNGFPSSYEDQLTNAVQPQQIYMEPGVTCQPWARVTVSTRPGGGWFSGPGACGGLRTDTGVATVNLLRANTIMATARRMCGFGPPAQALQVRCFSRAAGVSTPYTVVLSPTGFVSVNGRLYDARDSSLTWAPGGQYGLVLLFNRSAHVSGTLGSNGRLTVMVADDGAATGRISEPPSVILDRRGAVGSDRTATSSVGFISTNDIIAIERTACPLSVRAAMIASGGMLSMDPAYRGQIATGDTVCTLTPAMSVKGSISGHDSMFLSTGMAGYDNRTYSYDAKLFHNPPPLFPTTRSWGVQTTSLANIDCFSATIVLQDRTGCT